MKLDKITLVAALAALSIASPAPHGDDLENDRQSIEHSEPLESAHHQSASPATNDAAAQIASEPPASSKHDGDAGVSVSDEHDEHGHGMMGHSNMTDMEPSPAKMGAHHHHGRPILDDPNLEPQQRAYWEQYDTTTFLNSPAPAKAFLTGHIALSILAWVFVYPVTVMLSVEKSPFFLPLQTVHSAMVVVSLFCLGIYGATAPDLYPNNAYAKVSWMVFFYVVVHWFAAAIKTLANWDIVSSRSGPLDGADYVLANLNNNAHYDDERMRLSQDSGHGIASPTGTSSHFDDNQLREDVVNSHMSSSSSSDEEDGPKEEEDMYMFGEDPENYAAATPSASSFESRVQNRFIGRVMQNRRLATFVTRLGGVADTLFTLLNRPMFLVGFGYLLLGTATVFCMAKEKKVFNILAHFIKGGIFFLFGIVTLARYLGAFADQGMAWNIKPGSMNDPAVQHQKDTASQYGYTRPREIEGLQPNYIQRLLGKLEIPSMEFVECFLIFVYGISNIFLEHLGNEDGQWSHKDLQHASIAFMYLGGGICGLLIESGRVRRLLAKVSQEQEDREGGNEVVRRSFSFNPFPAFIVFWTGVLMSKHAQELELSTEIHIQWGVLFCVAALARVVTYLLMYLGVPKSTAPTRPFPELVTAFCLICGGLVFIESNSQTVEAMIYRGLDGMFTLNVNVGVAALIMAWVMLVMWIKGLAHQRRFR